MRGTLLWLAIAVHAGCDDGIYIEVQAPPGIHLDRVELIVGDRPCKLDGARCDGVQPPGFTEHLGGVGDVYFRDDEDGSYSAQVTDGSAYFQLQAGEGQLQIIALGTTGETVTAAAVLAEIDLSRHPVRYVTPLEPAADLEATRPGDVAEAGVQVWRRTDQIGCVGVDDYHTSRGPVFIVPESDPDCDEIAFQPECDPLGHLVAGFAADPGNPTCVAPFPTVSDNQLQACMFGGPACSENPAGQTACGPTNICVPSAVCTQCSLNFNQQCAAAALRGPETTHLSCKFGVELDPNTMDYLPCANLPSVAHVDLSVAKRLCSDLPLLSALDQLGFGHTVDLSSNGHTIQLSTENLTAMCNFDVTLEGSIDPVLVLGGGVAVPPAALFDLNFPAVTTGPTYDMLLPLQIVFEQNCTSPNACQLVSGNTGEEQIFNCAR
ncbi:MAG: hypothetical protein H6Q90_1817 [Deltaproteobacteria bacterium]|nr:hypothetical protein [Deltaproteobacteria bacterium]